MNYPFKQKRINENTIIRVFSKDVDTNELVWHRDRSDRLIEVISGRGWYIQLENKIPQKLTDGSKVIIEAGQYHRVIKGDGDLKIRIHEKKKGLWANIHAKKKRGEKSNPRSKEYQSAKKAGQRINRNESDSIKEAEPESTIKYNADPALKGDQTKLPDKLQKGIIDKARNSKSSKKEVDENEKSNHPSNYGAPEGSKRDKQLDQTQADLKKAKKLRKDGKSKQAKELEQRAYKRRDRMERQEREKNESLRMSESQIRDMIREFLIEELSAKVKKSLDKKAEKRGFTKGSVYKEFEKGLAAFATSGSRKGMTAHQWAHARVNSANPSKKWAVVKKSKAKKKK